MGHGKEDPFVLAMGMLLFRHGLVYLVILPVLLNGMN
jgi:hypothetical protein